MSHLIDVSDLARMIEIRPNLLLLDVRWQLGNPNTAQEYRDGHIPGAVFVDLDRELAAPPTQEQGRHPLPTEADFQNTVRRWGVHRSDTVVVYDDVQAMAAARAWWLLRHAGFDRVLVLDGGYSAWKDAGQPIEEGSVEPASGGDFPVRFGSLQTISLEQAGRFTEPGDSGQPGVLLDVRAPERYRGETEPIDPRAGHIPGALNAPTGGNLGADGRWQTEDALAERFKRIGVTGNQPVAVYCGSGVTATHTVLALAQLGIDAALYPGSWSQWSNQAELPIERDNA